MSNHKNKYSVLFYTEENQPFSYYIEPISKDAYEYWDSNGGMEALYKHLHKMSGLITYDLLKANGEDLKELLDAECSEIPAQARVLPADPNSIHAESVYWYSSFLCGMIHHWDPQNLSNYILEIHDISTADQEASLVWKGSFAELMQNNSKAIERTPYTIREKIGYYSHFIQSEGATVTGHLELSEEFDLNRLLVKTSVDAFYGECIDLNSFYYKNAQGESESINLDWDFHRSNLAPYSLHNGIEICEAN